MHAVSLHVQAFSTSASRSADMAKLLLIGRLGKDPELRYTKSNKEYVSYTIATANNTIGLPEGTQPTTTWHNLLSFNPSSNNYLRTLKKGSLVYAEANFELRQPDPNADPDSPEGQRQIFLRHETIRVLRTPPRHEDEPDAE
ncbi:nucleic acid-binding protein [Polyporus arcularius HHB13444]|uniref:Nucleic acid-binding protein n=1 Tax=Polyporus arcularius HHB13444 TaxID=1314778 RepID=A0A5C3PT64_9APHY|nr:nucleic acid-binding protein [Polyporus arcularius HHB13444]